MVLFFSPAFSGLPLFLLLISAALTFSALSEAKEKAVTPEEETEKTVKPGSSSKSLPTKKKTSKSEDRIEDEDDEDKARDDVADYLSDYWTSTRSERVHGRNDCTSNGERRRCIRECRHDSDCRRVKRRTSCDRECRGVCRWTEYMLIKKGEHCIVNLMTFLHRYRERHYDYDDYFDYY